MHKKPVIYMVLLFLFIQVNSALASNWVFVERREDPEDLLVYFFETPFTTYLEADFVFQDGDNLVFWEKTLFDYSDFGNRSKDDAELRKYQVNLTNQQIRLLEHYSYRLEFGKKDQYYQIIKDPIIPGGWMNYKKGSIHDRHIIIAQKYAKDGKDTGKKPTL